MEDKNVIWKELYDLVGIKNRWEPSVAGYKNIYM